MGQPPFREPASATFWVRDEAQPSPAAKADTSSLSFGTTVLPDVEWDASRPSLRARSASRFVSVARLGEGGLGEVVAALDNDIGRKVAIKRIRADVASSDTIVRFLQEIRTVGRLEHANIIPIHDVGRDEDGALYFIMRHVDGETLESIIARLRAGDPAAHREFGFERRVQIVTAVLDALAFAHARGVIHRDIKPANVMIGPYGEVMLLDWGVAQLAGAVHHAHEESIAPSGSALRTKLGTLLGTPSYMSPEQARGSPIDARSDLYSVTVMLHELLTLSHYLAHCPDLETVLAQVATRPVPKAWGVRSPHQDPVPMDLTWFIDKGVQKDPALRYPSADAMLQRLARRAEGDIPVQCPMTFTRRASFLAVRFLERHLIGLTVAVGVMATGLVLAAGVAVALASQG